MRLTVMIVASAQAYRAGVEKMIVDATPDLFVTLAFNRAATLDGARASLRKFLARIARATVGPKWQKRQEQCAKSIAIAENVDTNLHLHLALTVPLEHRLAVKSLSAAIWCDLEPAGSVDVQDVSDAVGLANYMTKQIAPEKSDHLLL